MRWSPLIALCLLILAPEAVLAAPPACAPEIVGGWTGKVLDDGVIKELHTDFSTASGALTGHYHIEGAGGGAYDGTLTDFTPTGPCAGRFLWHDRNGTGVVWVDFQPDRDRFDGEWGEEAPLEGHIFTGRRYRPTPVS